MTISKRILIPVSMLILLLSVSLGSVSVLISTGMVQRNTENALRDQAELAAYLVSSAIHAQLNILQELANRAQTGSMDWQLQRESLMGDIDRIGSEDFAIVYKDGVARHIRGGEAPNIAEREYVQKGFRGEQAVSDVIVNGAVPSVDHPIINYVAPIIVNENVEGLLLARNNAVIFTDIVNEISISRGGYAYIVDSAGTIVAHRDYALVNNRFSPMDEAETDPSLQSLSTAVQRMLEDREGTARYQYNGRDVFSVFTPIPDYPLILVATVEHGAVMRDVRLLQNASVAVIVAFMLLGLIVALLIARSISAPINKTMLILKDIAEGEGPIIPHLDIQSNDEIGKMAHYFNLTVEKIKRLYDEAEAASRAKSQFLAQTSHEIRTPMNAIIGMSELAERSHDKSEMLEYVAEIKQAGKNLLSIINDILDFSKIESGNIDLNPAPYETASVLNDVLNIINIRMRESGVAFITDIDAEIPARMIGDATRIRQILLNLLNNAAKFTREGFVKLTITGERDGDAEHLRFAVEDSGIGIRSEDIPKLFNNFVRVDQSNGQINEGTGLGLVIARRLCREMNGDISVQSEYGKGSVFTATITQERLDDRPLGTIAKKSYVRKDNADVRFTAPTARVLIADDVTSNLKVSEGLLAPYRMQVDTCKNGLEAVRLARKNRYDIIFMDHMMPEMDGVAATEEIRSFLGDYFRKVPIIALTANAISGMQEVFLEKGFSDYLSKPIEIRKLNEIMDRWMPGEKREKAAAGAAEELARPAGRLEIDGVDVSRGIEMTGGSESGYLEVLELFRMDVLDRMEILREMPDSQNLLPFITCVHALKSAAGSIGAVSLSQMAERLEKAGTREDTETIRAELSGFRAALLDLVEAIKDLPSVGRSK
jgi:signal transduction histidine kinase/CheY-like chemotaxis protein